MKYACEYCLTLFDEESDCTSHEHECEGNPDKDDWEEGEFFGYYDATMVEDWERID